MYTFAPPRRAQTAHYPAHRYAYDDVDQDDNDKYDLDDDVFNPKGKNQWFFVVFIDLGWSTFKDDKLEEKNYDDDLQSEGKTERFFNGFVMTMNLDDFITKWSFSIRR